MNKQSERLLEALLIIGLSISVAVGCAGDGNEKAALAKSFDSLTTEIETLQAETNVDLDSNRFVEENKHKKESKATAGKPADTKASVDLSKNNFADVPSKTASVVPPADHVYYFDTNSYSLTEEDEQSIKQHALFIKNHPGLMVTVSGHADGTGSAFYNEVISEKRALAIYKLLVDSGVSRSQLLIESYGEALPLYNEEQHGQNRRVELKYSGRLRLTVGKTVFIAVPV